MSMDGFEEYVSSRPERLNNEQHRLNLLKDKMKDEGYNALLNQSIKFGKYKNYSYFMLPKSYVEWMKSKNMLLTEILEAFKLYEQIEQTERTISHLMRDPYD